MHIMEGFLPLEWCLFWLLLSAPVLVWGARTVRRMFREEPEKKLMVAAAGAFMFVLSALKLPSVGGSSSHPTGAGVSTVLYGVGITSLLSLIVLLFQALLLAHGGLTTLGANVFSMGIAGPFAAYLVFRGLGRLGAGRGTTVFAAAFTADLVTYSVTATQLALAFPGADGVLGSLQVFLTIFALTQVPLAILEGLMTVMFFDLLARSRPELLDGRLAAGRKLGRRSAAALLVFLAVTVAGMAAFVVVADLTGADDLGSDAIQQIAPGFTPWADSILSPEGPVEIVLFALQALVGAAILFLVIRRWKRSRDGEETCSP